MRMHIAWLSGLLLLGCDDGGGEPADPLGCNDSMLVAQCPAGSNPVLGVRADDACTGAVGGIAQDGQGQASGQCIGTASCRVLCQFAVPCRCGVAEVSRDGVVCASCEGAASCGNGECEGGETPENCAIDCGMACMSGERRCDGDTLEECSLQGRWDRLDCPAGEVCSVEDGPARCVRDTGVIMGDDMGVDGGPDGGVPDDERVIPGAGGWPAMGDTTRGMTPRAFDLTELRVRLTDGSVNSRPTRFAQAQVKVAKNAGGPQGQPRPFAALQYAFVPGEPRIEAFSVAGRFQIDLEGAVLLPEVEFTADRALFCMQWRACIGGAEEPCEDLIARELQTYTSTRLQCIAEHLASGAERACFDINFGDVCGWDPRLLYPESVEFGGRHVQRQGDRVVGHGVEPGTAIWLDLATEQVQRMAQAGEFVLRGEAEHFDLSVDGQTAAFVAGAGRDEVIIVWDLQSDERRAILPRSGGAANGVRLSPDGQVLALQINGTQDPVLDRNLSFWRIADEIRLFSIRPPDGSDFNTLPVFSPDGRHAAFATRFNVEIWDMTRLERTQILDFDGQTLATGMRFSPDGALLAVAWAENQGTLWDVATGQRIGNYDNAGLPVFEPEGTRALGIGGSVFRGSFYLLTGAE